MSAVRGDGKKRILSLFSFHRWCVRIFAMQSVSAFNILSERLSIKNFHLCGDGKLLFISFRCVPSTDAPCKYIVGSSLRPHTKACAGRKKNGQKIHIVCRKPSPTIEAVDAIM